MDTIVPQKRCSHCKQSLPPTLFHRNRSNKDGRSDVCKECAKARQSEFRDSQKRAIAENRIGNRLCSICQKTKALTEFRGGYYAYCKECARARQRKYYRENHEREKERGRKTRLKFAFNITPEEYNIMVLKQAGLCAICGQAPKKGTILHIDHCHKTGLIRELLCAHCNSTLGYAHDNAEVLRKAAAYIEKHSI